VCSSDLLPDRSAADTTFRHLLSLADERLGSESFIDLHDRELVSVLECPSCGGRENLGLVEARITPSHAPCSHCGHEMRDPETTHIVTGADWFADRTLAEAGIPPLDVIEARSADGAVAFEMTGDLGRMLANDD
jgi:predicted RNA-binding Zn-ribbon protein involved in translation (DUF1610 family)